MSDKIDKELIDRILSKEHPVEFNLGDNESTLIDYNIHVDKDEDINDFFVSWKKFKHRPSKISLFSQFNSDSIWDILRNQFNVEDGDINKISEIFPDNYGIVYNTKYYISVTDDISISFFEFDKEGDSDDTIEEIYSSNLSIYYNQNNVSVDEINAVLNIFQSSMIDINTEEGSHKTINILHINLNNTFELKPLEINESIKKKDLKFYYNKKVIEQGNNSIELINNNNRGLTIFDGERGNGKTTFINYMINELDKKIIYIPATVIEHSFSNIDFSDFLKANSDSVFIFDDCELFFSRKIQNNNIYAINLLQILDGITSNSMNVNFVLCMNTTKEDIDTNLFDSNSFLSNITFDKLDKNTANKLSNKLGKNIKYNNSIKLNDVIRGKSNGNESSYY